MTRLFHEERTGALRDAFEREVLGWPGVTAKKMFGCPSYRANGTMFAAIVDAGVVLTQLDDELRRAVLEQFSAGPFETGRQSIGRWLVLPVDGEDELDRALEFVRESYFAALGQEAAS